MLFEKVIMINRTIYACILLLTVSGLVSCTGSTRLIESWYDESYVEEPELETVLVLGIFQDDIQRRAFESKFVEGVISGGKQAIAGYTLMPENEDYDDKQDIAAAIKKTNADSVLITSFKGVSEQERHIQPRVDYVPAMGFGHYGSYYGAAYQRVYSPGYTVVDTVVSLETRVYSVKAEKLVWAGNTKSVNSASSETIAQELVKIVTDDMRKSGLIK
jgi:hypothetical protein